MRRINLRINQSQDNHSQSQVDLNSPQFKLFLSSFLMLFAEIMAIRWTAVEVPAIRLMPNLVLIVAFIGGAAGVAAPNLEKRSIRYGAAGALMLTIILSFAPFVQLSHWSFAERANAQLISTAAAVALLVVISLSIVMTFRFTGSIIGAAFQELPALKAYSINLAGSLAGIFAFAAFSFLNLGPAVWMACCCAVVVLLLPTRKTFRFALALLLISLCTAGSFWSPYRKIDLRRIADTSGVTSMDGSFFLYGNNFFYQSGMRLPDAEQLARLESQHPDHPMVKELRRYQKSLEIPYSFARSRNKVLVLGSGVGNDVLHALQEGCATIDAVELDPVIAWLGRTRHPSMPYSDPRVRLHVEDARTFLRTTGDKYGLINFCFIDPGHAGAVSSCIRVDNFVYTVEAFKAALNHLAPDGVAVVSFSSPAGTMGLERLYFTIWSAIGHPPLAIKLKGLDIGNELSTSIDKAQLAVFVFGPGVDRIDTENGAALSEGGVEIGPGVETGRGADSVRWQDAVKASLQNAGFWPGNLGRPATDDWPFLYLKFDAGPMFIYYGVLLFLVALSLSVTTRPAVRDFSDRQWLSMFFMGMAFMLLETKAITQLSLVFGSTWMASSAAIAGVLILAWLANKIVASVRAPNLPLMYFCLIASLLLNYFWTVPEITQMPAASVAVLACAINTLPILFSGIIFSSLLNEARCARVAFSANLLGVAFGGLAENLSVVFGLRALALIAIALYVISFTTALAGLTGRQRTDTVQEGLEA